MTQIDFIQMDKVFYEALALQANTPAEHLHRTVKVSNIKNMYCEYQMFWPALDAAQREVFDACEREALVIGIERKATR